MNKLKMAWKSWTIWFNALAATLLAGLPTAAEMFPQMQAYLPHTWYQALGALVIGANILLRFKTNKPLDEK